MGGEDAGHSASASMVGPSQQNNEDGVILQTSAVSSSNESGYQRADQELTEDSLFKEKTAPSTADICVCGKHFNDTVAHEERSRRCSEHNMSSSDSEISTTTDAVATVDVSKMHSDNKESRLTQTLSANTHTSEPFSHAGIDEVQSQESKSESWRWWHYLLLKDKHPSPVPTKRVHSPEFEAGFFSLLTWQWMAPIMIKGYKRPLELMDIWTVNPNRSADVMTTRLKQNWAKRRREPGNRQLLMALYDTFKFEFVLGGVCQLVSSIVSVLNPFVLRYLIAFAGEAYEAKLNPNLNATPDIGRGVGLVFAITILQIIQSTCTNQFLYKGMMNGGQARATLISLIFEKALTISGRAKAGGNSHAAPMPPLPNVEPGTTAEKNYFKRLLGHRRKNRKDTARGRQTPVNEQGWTNGRIINLMSTDSYRVDQASGLFHMIWTAPISIVVTLILLLININYSALAGFGLFVVAMPILTNAIRKLFRRRGQISKLTDQRVSLTQEILQAVRFVKLFGWEESFLKRIENIRGKEIRSIQVLLAIRNGILAISTSMPIFASMLAFITFSLTNHGLNPALIFSSLALFNSLRLPLNLLPLVLGQVVDGAAALKRIQGFLEEEDAKDETDWDFDSRSAIRVSDASFTWERTTGKDEKPTKQPAEKARERKKSGSEAQIAVSKTGVRDKDESSVGSADRESSDKTDYDPGSRPTDSPFHIDGIDLSIGRGELVAVIGGVGSGKSSLLAALAGDMRKTSGSFSLGANRAFCPQYAWIQNTTVKDNILFGKPMDVDWYNKVLDACALRPDLDMLPAGDQTEIGERGITLSGGQKQRLNIARAVYFNSDIVLMDDPLSAVDAHVGRHIMNKTICGLMHGKCRVLATHQLWVLSRCDRIIWMHGGRIAAFDTYENLLASNQDFKKLVASNAQDGHAGREGDGGPSDDIQEVTQKGHRRRKQASAALMQQEERAVNSVSWEVYSAYVHAGGSWGVVAIIIILLITSQGSTIVTSLWLSWWTSNKFGYAERVYIGIYAALGVVQALLLFAFSIGLTIAGTMASKVMLHRALTRVLRAPMSFFDTTPLGRITNRFSKDIDTMDNVLSDSFRFFLMTSGSIISVFILIIAYYYYFAVALVPLMAIFVVFAGFYRASAREIKRHESVLRSHVFARFSEAVTGTSTIRAYGVAATFSRTVSEALDQMNSAYFLTFANQRWLSVRLDMIGNLLVFAVGILVVTSRFDVNPSIGGLVLSYILSIVQMIQFTVRQLAEVENNMNSAERVHFYGTKLEEEAPSHFPDDRLSPGWPASGKIEFENISMRYRAGLPLVLKSLSLKVEGGERVGVIGRTGAGKSSLMSALFRLIELSSGRVTIDGVDISTIGLADLRSRLAIIPQDPTLFRGTVRSNLDPFNNYTDLELWSALRQADLVDAQVPESKTDEKGVETPGDETLRTTAGRFNLDSPVEEEGLNFSLGQRQLMALARALVRNAQIIVCDEATSSIDMSTDERIQLTMKTAFEGRTVLCIAHRLKTILTYDRIVVMSNGEIAEIGTPLELYKANGLFTSMCNKSQLGEKDF